MCRYPLWQADEVFVAGDVVEHHAHLFKAVRHTLGDPPHGENTSAWLHLGTYAGPLCNC